MSEDLIDPSREFYYETGIDPTGGELDTGEEELIEDEKEFVGGCCCHQGLSVGSLQESTDYMNLQIRRLNMIEQHLQHGVRLQEGMEQDAEACAAIAIKTMGLADLW